MVAVVSITAGNRLGCILPKSASDIVADRSESAAPPGSIPASADTAPTAGAAAAGGERSAEDILIAAPTQLGQWLRRYHATVEAILPAGGTTTFCPNAALTPDAHRRRYGRGPEGFETPVASRARQAADAFSQEALGVTMRCCDVDHPAHSSGLILTANAEGGRVGWKLVYSGDTRPCRELCAAGQGATVSPPSHQTVWPDLAWSLLLNRVDSQD